MADHKNANNIKTETVNSENSQGEDFSFDISELMDGIENEKLLNIDDPWEVLVAAPSPSPSPDPACAPSPGKSPSPSPAPSFYDPNSDKKLPLASLFEVDLWKT